MKKQNLCKTLFPLALGSLFILSGCTAGLTSTTTTSISNNGEGSVTSAATSNTEVSIVAASSTVAATEHTLADDEVQISLADGASTTSGANVSIDNSKNIITISAVGTYVLSGTLSDGAVIITAEETTSSDTVELILNGVAITAKGTRSVSVNSTTIYPGPIFSANSAKLHVKALSGSANIITDNRSASLSVGDDSAAIFSNKKLKLKGAGSLKVTSAALQGLASDSKVEAATLTLGVNAYSHAIKAHDSVILGGAQDLGSFTLTSTEADGTCIRVDEDNEVTTPVYGNAESNDEIAGIELKDAAFAITSKGNCLSSEAHVYLEGGNGTITSSAGKGVKSEFNMFVDGGAFTIVSKTDDCLHSTEGYVKCNGGTYTLTSGTSSGCQGIKGETAVYITGGSFTVTASYEGLAAHIIEVSGGASYVTSSDDGWSAGGTNEQTSSACSVKISGGTNFVNAGGDGIDSNGSFTISGGTTIVAAPSSGGNGPLDSGDNYAITVTGGNIFAYGITGMTESLGGTQNSVVLASHTQFSSGNYYVLTQGGNTWAVKAARNTSTVVASFSDFSSGAVALYQASNVTVSETLFAGGSFYKASAYTATSTLYTGTFSAATNSHLQSGSSGGGGGGGFPGGGPGR